MADGIFFNHWGVTHELRLELFDRPTTWRAVVDPGESFAVEVVFDFDGVMTDNAVYLNENGQESVRCDRGDGMGIETGVPTARLRVGRGLAHSRALMQAQAALLQAPVAV